MVEEQKPPEKTEPYRPTQSGVPANQIAAEAAQVHRQAEDDMDPDLSDLEETEADALRLEAETGIPVTPPKRQHAPISHEDVEWNRTNQPRRGNV